jgi:outer membrane lipoprotein-sorting protein
MKRKVLTSIGILLLSTLLIGFAATSLVAEEKLTALEILQRMDKFVSGYDDQYIESVMRIIDVNGDTKEYSLVTWQIGTQKRLIRFTSGEVKGMSMLILDRDNSWVYLPGYKKVRRVASHQMNQTFAGSDFTNNDMASAIWADAWKPELVKEDETYYYLKCTPLPGQKMDYGSALVYVNKDGFSQDQVDYFNTKGEKVKVYKNTQMKQWSPTLRRHSLIIMEDARTGHKTEIVVQKMEVNIGLKDSKFTKRELQWGR